MYHLYEILNNLGRPPLRDCLPILLRTPLKALKYTPSQIVQHPFVTLHLGIQRVVLNSPLIKVSSTSYKDLQLFLYFKPNYAFVLRQSD